MSVPVMTNVQESAQRLLKETGTVFLATMGDNDLPDVRAMAIAKAEGLKTVWMLTSTPSEKITQLNSNVACMLYAHTFGQSHDPLELRLWGNAEVLNDPKELRVLWRDEMRVYFARGLQDPHIRIIKFTANYVKVSTLSGFETFGL